MFLCLVSMTIPICIALCKSPPSLSVSPLLTSPFPPPGLSISVVEEDGVQQLYITDVKAGGLAFAKGLITLHFHQITPCQST